MCKAGRSGSGYKALAFLLHVCWDVWEREFLEDSFIVFGVCLYMTYGAYV